MGARQSETSNRERSNERRARGPDARRNQASRPDLPALPRGLRAFVVDGDAQLAVVTWDDDARGVAPDFLTGAEREVMALVVAGRSNAEIAAARGTAVRTVANQVAHLLAKVGARSRRELLARFAVTPP